MNKSVKYLMVIPKGYITHLQVELYYSRGGLNLGTYRQEAKGYYLAVRPVQREFRNGVYYTTYGYGTGVKQMVLPAERQSAKRLSIAQDRANEQQREIVAQVLQKHGLELAA